SLRLNWQPGRKCALARVSRLLATAFERVKESVTAVTRCRVPPALCSHGRKALHRRVRGTTAAAHTYIHNYNSWHGGRHERRRWPCRASMSTAARRIEDDRASAWL